MDPEGGASELSGYVGLLGAMGREPNVHTEGGLTETKSEEVGREGTKLKDIQEFIELNGQDDLALLTPSPEKKKRKRNRNRRKNKLSDFDTETEVISLPGDNTYSGQNLMEFNDFVEHETSETIQNIDTTIVQSQDRFTQYPDISDDNDMEQATSETILYDDTITVQSEDRFTQCPDTSEVNLVDDDFPIIDFDDITSTVNIIPSDQLVLEDDEPTNTIDVPSEDSLNVIYVHPTELKVSTYVAISQTDVIVLGSEVSDATNVESTPRSISETLFQTKVKAQSDPVIPFEIDTSYTSSTQSDKNEVYFVGEEVKPVPSCTDVSVETPVDFPNWATEGDILNGNYLQDDESENFEETIKSTSFSPSDMGGTYSVDTFSCVPPCPSVETARSGADLEESYGNTETRGIDFGQLTEKIEAHAKFLETNASFESLLKESLMETEQEIQNTLAYDTDWKTRLDNWKTSNPIVVDEVRTVLDEILDDCITNSEIFYQQPPPELEMSEAYPSDEVQQSDSLNNLLVLETSGDYTKTYPQDTNTIEEFPPQMLISEGIEHSETVEKIDEIEELDMRFKDGTPTQSEIDMQIGGIHALENVSSELDDEFYDALSYISYDIEYFTAPGSPQMTFGTFPKELNLENNTLDEENSLESTFMHESSLLFEPLINDQPLEIFDPEIMLKETKLLELDLELENCNFETMDSDSQGNLFEVDYGIKCPPVPPRLFQKAFQDEIVTNGNEGLLVHPFPHLEPKIVNFGERSLTSRLGKKTVNGGNGHISVITGEERNEDAITSKRIRNQILGNRDIYEWPDFNPVYVPPTEKDPPVKRGKSLSHRFTQGLRTVIPCMSSAKDGIASKARDSLECIKSPSTSAETVPNGQNDPKTKKKKKKVFTLPRNLKLVSN